MTSLKKRRDAHVADLHFALLHGIHHVRARVDDFEVDVDTMLLEESLLDTDEHRQMAEVVADHGLDHGEWLGDGGARAPEHASQ